MFGVKMAKGLLKKAKKAAKSVKKEVKKEVKQASSSARDHIESIAHSRRDAAIVWGMIKDGNQSDSEIKEILESKGFSQLLSEI